MYSLATYYRTADLARSRRTRSSFTRPSCPRETRKFSGVVPSERAWTLAVYLLSLRHVCVVFVSITGEHWERSRVSEFDRWRKVSSRSSPPTVVFRLRPCNEPIAVEQFCRTGELLRYAAKKFEPTGTHLFLAIHPLPVPGSFVNRKRG